MMRLLLSAAILAAATVRVPAQDAAHLVTTEKGRALRFTALDGRGDVVVRLEDELVFDAALAVVFGKDHVFCPGALHVSETHVRFTAVDSERFAGRWARDCRKSRPLESVSLNSINGLKYHGRFLSDFENILAIALRPKGPLELGVSFRAAGTEKTILLLNERGALSSSPPPYQLLLTALSAPAAARAAFKDAERSAPIRTADAASATGSLYEEFFNKRRTDPDAAYVSAKAFLATVKDSPTTPDTEFARQWVAAYEKVKGTR